MADVTSAISKMLVAETDFNSAISEAMVQKQSANINGLIDNVQFHSELLTGSGSWLCPVGIHKVEVTAAGGGGGGGGGGESATTGFNGNFGANGLTGSNTTFNALVVSVGGTGGRGGNGGNALGGGNSFNPSSGVSIFGTTLDGVSRGNGGAGGAGGGAAAFAGQGGNSGKTSYGHRIFSVIPGNLYAYVSGAGGTGGAGGAGTPGTNGSAGSTGSAGALLLIY